MEWLILNFASILQLCSTQPSEGAIRGYGRGGEVVYSVRVKVRVRTCLSTISAMGYK